MGNSNEKVSGGADPYLSALEKSTNADSPAPISKVSTLKSLRGMSQVFDNIGGKLPTADWFQATAGVKECTEFLEKQPEGSFIILQPDVKSSSFSLLVVHNDKVLNQEIKYTPPNKYSLAAVKNNVFSSLEELVEHYRTKRDEVPVVLSSTNPKFEPPIVSGNYFQSEDFKRQLSKRTAESVNTFTPIILTTTTDSPVPTTTTVATTKKGPTASYEDWDPTSMTPGAFYGAAAAQTLTAAPSAPDTSTPTKRDDEGFGFGAAEDDGTYGSSGTRAPVTADSVYGSSTEAKQSSTTTSTPTKTAVAVVQDSTYGSSPAAASLPPTNPATTSAESATAKTSSGPTTSKPLDKKAFTLKPADKPASADSKSATLGKDPVNKTSFGPLKPAKSAITRAPSVKYGFDEADVEASETPAEPTASNDVPLSSSDASQPLTEPAAKTTVADGLPAPPPRLSKDMSGSSIQLNVTPPSPSSVATEITDPAQVAVAPSSNAEPIYELPVQLGKRINTNPSDVFEWFRAVDPRCNAPAKSPLWIHSSQLSRKETERIFARFSMQSGLFLVRQRVSKPGEKISFALSLVIDTKIEHHIIHPADDGYSLQGTSSVANVTGADTLEELVNKMAQASKPGRPILGVCVPIIGEDKYDRPDWLHGAISREEANARLFEDSQFVDGRFLVRLSGKQQDKVAYVISMIFDQKVFHHLVTPERNGWHVNGTLCGDAKSLTEVIQFLQVPNPTLPCVLQTYVPARPPYELLRRESTGVSTPTPNHRANNASRPLPKQASADSIALPPPPPPIASLLRQTGGSLDEQVPPPPRRPSLDVHTPLVQLPTEDIAAFNRRLANQVELGGARRGINAAPEPPAGARRPSMAPMAGPIAPPRRDSIRTSPVPPRRAMSADVTAIAPDKKSTLFARTTSQPSITPPASPRPERREFQNVYVDANTIFHEMEELIRPDEAFELIKEADSLPPTFVRLGVVAENKLDSMPKGVKLNLADMAKFQ